MTFFIVVFVLPLELGDVVGSMIPDEDSVFMGDTVNLSGIASPSSPNIRSSTNSKNSGSDAEPHEQVDRRI